MDFYNSEPTLENYWRSIILFGRNVASYKFALAKSMYELTDISNDLVKMDELAVPFSRNLCEHLLHSPKQLRSNSSRFLDSCNAFNNREISHNELIKQTVKLGFNNVIDAFHTVNGLGIEKRFFIDERKTNNGIRVTEDFFKLSEHSQFVNFESETDARWSLVEQAWKMGVSTNLIQVEYDTELKTLFTSDKKRRTTITSCRNSLNGYQKGRCFYCFDNITVDTNSDNLADVDHFLPWTLNSQINNIDGIWNLVLSCKDCNRGENGKFAKIPTINLLKRLHKRNEYFITSHLPLRETLILQTGKSEKLRINFLQKHYNKARSMLIHDWEPIAKGSSTF